MVRYGRGRQGAILVALWLAVLVVGLDTMVLSVALATLSKDLGASNAQLQWVTDAYTLALAALLLPVGLLSDRYGRRTVLLAGLAVFGLASAACAEVDSPAQLIAARAVLGIGAAVLLSVPLSIVPTVFRAADKPTGSAGTALGTAGTAGTAPGTAGTAGTTGTVGTSGSDGTAARGGGRTLPTSTALAILVSGMMLGLPLGPLLGGWLLGHFWWGSVFLINVPIVLVAMIVVALTIPQSRAVARRPDLLGVALSTLGLVALVYGVIEGPERGWTSPPVLVGLGAAVPLLAGFVAWQARARQPLVRLGLFADRRFSVGVLAMTLAGFALFGVVFVLPQYVQVVLGTDAFGAGVRLLPLIAGMLVAAPVGDRLCRRFGRRLPVAGGLLVVTAGLMVQSRVDVSSGYRLTALAMLIEGFGISLALSPAMDSALATFDTDDAATGSSLVQAIRQVGAALSIAILGSVLNAAYRDRLDPALTGLPPAASHAARGSVGGAAEVAHRMGPAGAPLRAAADGAFVHGMSVMLLVCAVAAAVSAVAAALLLPNRDRPEPEPAATRPAGAEPAALATGGPHNGRHEG
ncbi:MFS transporter [Actinocatenispora sera]|uniref:MFS transporter n=1 Tax=Actinocatenispora sera TaxID=390989 RepID=UPI0033C6421A